MYILVRKDLEAIYRMVQGAHALAAYGMHPDTHESFFEWGNQTIVFLGVRNEAELLEVNEYLHEKGIYHASFCEPDLSNQMTAIACYAPEKIFKKYDIITL
jgi:hypothetical protein